MNYNCNSVQPTCKPPGFDRGGGESFDAWVSRSISYRTNGAEPEGGPEGTATDGRWSL